MQYLYYMQVKFLYFIVQTHYKINNDLEQWIKIPPCPQIRSFIIHILKWTDLSIVSQCLMTSRYFRKPSKSLEGGFVGLMNWFQFSKKKKWKPSSGLKLVQKMFDKQLHGLINRFETELDLCKTNSPMDYGINKGWINLFSTFEIWNFLLVL